MRHELLIIGAGPAGVSAALYAKRANIDTGIIYLKDTALNTAHMIDNYYGLAHIKGSELFEKGLRQCQDFDIALYEEEVIDINWDEDFKVVTTKGEHFAKSLILASGAKRNVPKIKNYKEYEGRGLSYCATCDGFFYKGKVVAVLGDGSYALHEAEYLKNLAKEVYILTSNRPLKDAHLESFEIYDKEIDMLYGEDKIQGVRFKDGQELPLDGLFVAEGIAGSLDLARKLGVVVTDKNEIEVNAGLETNIPGLFAAGDLISGMKQVAKAVYDGALAANSAIAFIKRN